MGTHHPPTDESRARARLQDKMRQRGTPSLVRPDEFAQIQGIVLKARTFGMDDDMIGSQVGLHPGGIYKIRMGYTKTCRRPTYEKLLTLHPEAIASRPHDRRGKVPDGSMQDATGTQRRLRALRADGYTINFLGEWLGVTPEAISDMARRPRKGVYRSTYLEVKAMYDKLSAAFPSDHGIEELTARRSKSYADKLSWAPSIYWDDDTIDDPNAFPDWTGLCGTVQGYFAHLSSDTRVQHYRQGSTTHPHKMRRTVLCKPCRTARSGSHASMKVYSDDVRAWALDMIDEGQGVRQVAAQIGCSTRTIERFKRERREGYVPVRTYTK